MDNKLNEYLGRVERRLRPLPAVERADIVKEIQSEMLELQADGAAPEQIVARLGDPRVLARSYLGDSIVKQRRFTWRKFGALLAFYSLAGAGWTIVLPVTSICAAAFLLSGALCPIAGIVKFAAYLMGYDLPVIGIQIGSYSMGAGLMLPVSFLIGAVLLLLGWWLWKVTLAIIRTMSRGRRKLSE